MSENLENTGKILVYQTEDGNTNIDVFFEEGTIWLTQRSIAELCQTSPQNITLHIKKIYECGELGENETCNHYPQLRNEGKRSLKRQMKCYNLDMILAIGCRVRSNGGVHFRRWASSVLTDLLASEADDIARLTKAAKNEKK